MKTRKPFAFKNFIIEQELVTLPVTTDACVFGALCNFENPQNILDIGTGTGLLAFFMNQKYPQANVIGLEKNHESAIQAINNLNINSKETKIRVIEADFFDFNPEIKFDAIISNPPFFKNQLESTTELKNQARHLQDHTFTEFYIKISTVLSSHGIAQILLPFSTLDQIQNDLKGSNLNIQSYSTIQANSSKNPHLIAISLGFDTCKQIEIEHEIKLKAPNNKFTNQAYNLLSPYYLEQALNL